MTDALAVLQSFDAIAVEVDRKGAITDWTHGFIELIARPPDELRGRPLWTFVSSAYRDGLRQVLSETATLRQSRRIETVMETTSGQRRIAWSCSLVSGTNDDAIVAWGIDVMTPVASIAAPTRRIGDELAAREQELSAIYKHAPGVLFYVAVEADGEFRFLSISDAGLVAMGLTSAQVVGSLVRDVIPPPSRDLVLSHYQEALRSGHTVRWREVSVYPAGRKVGEVAVTPLYDDRGVATHLIGIVHDVTERERFEEELQQREKRLRLALEASAAGLWTRDAGANQVDWDEGFRRLYGFSSDEPATFDAWLGRIHEEDRPNVLSLVDDMRHPTKDVWDTTFRIVGPDGTILWIQSVGRVERDSTGEVMRLVGLELNITARRQAEEALLVRRDEQHNRELSLLLETAAQGIVSVDAHGRIIMANRALEEMFGWAPGELIGQPLERLLPSSVHHAHIQHRTGYFGAPLPRLMGRDRQLVGVRKNGSTFPIEASLNHVATPDGGRGFAFVTDITERQRASDALRERTVELEHRTVQLTQLASDLTLAERHAREQLAKILHDGLQQALTVAAIHVEQQINLDSQRGVSTSPLLRAKHELDEAIAAARSLSVELSPPLLQSEGLSAALIWLADWNRHKYGLEVDVSVDPSADSTQRDVRTLLFESARELLFNAVKHAKVDRVRLDLSLDENDMLCITVADKGVGFDPARLVEQAKSSHVGWGLFSIRERLSLLGGRFDIESAPGRGTKFRVMAPRCSTHRRVLAELPESPADVGPTLREASARPLRILIADDHTTVRNALCELLQERPEFQVVGEAADGLEAIAQANALLPDVVLMDVSMPKMDGVEATRRIRASFPLVQVLGLSVSSRTKAPHPIELAGAECFFAKGDDAQDLIDHLLNKYRAITSGHPVSRHRDSLR